MEDEEARTKVHLELPKSLVDKMDAIKQKTLLGRNAICRLALMRYVEEEHIVKVIGGEGNEQPVEAELKTP